MNSRRTCVARRGMVVLYVIVAMIVLILFTSLSVDVGKVQMTRTELRTAVDAAALAGGRGLAISPAQARAYAKAAAQQNYVNGAPLTLLDSDIELGTWDPSARTFTKATTSSQENNANAVRINGTLAASRNTGVKLNFVPIISGVQTRDMTSSAISAASGLSEDIILVQDVSGSFEDHISKAKKGDKALLESMNVNGSKSYFGTVVFAGTAKTVSSIKKVTSNYDSLVTDLNKISVGGSGMPSTLSGTDIAAGIEKALDMFNSHSNTGNSRSIIIVSDGEPSASLLGAHPWHSSNGLLQLAQSEADEAWSKGIHVFVVFWNESKNKTAANNLKSLKRGKGTFIEVTDPNDLPDAIGLIFKGNAALVK